MRTHPTATYHMTVMSGAIHEYVGDLCRPLTQELDATYRQFLSDLRDLNQRLLNPRELIPSRSGTFAYSYNMAS